MNVSETRAEMLACVVALREQLTETADPNRRAELVAMARQKVERLRKGFKRQIDVRAASRFGFPINARKGIERRLSEVTAEALATVNVAAAKLQEAEPNSAPEPAV